MTSAVQNPTRVRVPGRRSSTADASRMERREGRAGYVLIAPTTVLLALFYLYPLAQTVYYSFTDWNPASGETNGFVGLSNFTGLFRDGEFVRAAGNTALYVVIVVPITMALGLFFAALLAQPFRGRGVYRALLFVPYIAPIVGSALIFSFILSPLGGLVNGVVTALGAPPIGFLTSEPWALVSVIVFSIWQGVGYTMIIYSAALTNIPASYMEAATLDGAGPIRRFFRISLPLVAPTTGFLAITGVIGALQVFTQVYVLTQGGPINSSETILYYIYNQGFVFFHGGSASAAAVLLLIVGILVAVVQLRVINRRDPIELN
ncbi:MULTISPECIES: carbohydrate ABC transporter permease [Curtobacterium]|uniref:carbohydrate ABC transporter permease n=2 Tax=Microbacteriaceae TaxID=85023 RepID=UPI000F899F01|nr:sugar ABC transporter permease [Curtobacterium sp. HSID17257]RUQ02699.1 sugar ABC transporter permease [Curtobacterium sp. HSID17257]